jgi:hypothetical protein
VGFGTVVDESPVAGDQLYESGAVPPVAVGLPPSVIVLPRHISLPEPALTVIGGEIRTITVSKSVQPALSVTVSMYVVVVVTVAVGFAAVD